MRRNRMAALTLSAGMVALVVAACSESVTTPPQAPTGFALNDVTSLPPPAAVAAKIIICKTGNIDGSFDVTRVSVGTSVDGAASGLNTIVADGSCKEVAVDNSGADNGSTVTISEDPAVDPVNTVQTFVSCSLNAGGSIVACPGTFTDDGAGDLFVNQFHGYVIVYNNVFTEPPPPEEGCTFTKGWYRNNGSDTVEGLDGLTKAQVQAIFNATPGQPGNVTFTTNNLLNLYQQLAAAILNGGTSGPAAVQSAITAALAGTTVTVGVGGSLNITTTMTKAQQTAAINTLSSFNEGSFAGFPHCGDEPVPAN